MESPIMPEWNNLKDDDRTKLCDVWEMWSCVHACGGDVVAFYNEVRRTLQEGERRYLRAVMEGPPHDRQI
jgi:hypothetical protein